MASATSGRLDPPQFQLKTTFGEGVVVHHTDDGEEVWKIGDRLGYGTYGEVILQTRSIPDHNQILYRAVKTIFPQPGDGKIYEKTVRRELSAMVALREHKDMFVTFFGWYQNPAKDTIFISMEYLREGDLYRYMKKDQQCAKQYCREIVTQILKALEIMHDKGFCHRDLKPANVLIASTTPLRVKLADFGIAKSTNPLASSMKTYRSGTTKYMAPEVQGYNDTHIRANKGYTNAVDMWSLGALTHEMFTGIAPFCTTPTEEFPDEDSEFGGSGIISCSGVDINLDAAISHPLLWRFCENSMAFPTSDLIKASAPEDLIDFIQDTMKFRPEERLSPSEALSHPWIKALVRPWIEPLDLLRSQAFLKYQYGSSTFSGYTVCRTLSERVKVWNGYAAAPGDRQPSTASGSQVFRVIKEVRRGGGVGGEADNLRRELNALIALQKHSDLFIKFYGWYAGSQSTIHIVMEYLPGGSLREFIQSNRVPNDHCRVIITQILKAVDIMHKMGICHRRLRPEHVLINPTSPLIAKLTGLHYCGSTGGPDPPRIFLGDERYLPPERATSPPVGGCPRVCLEAIDMWALGIITHEIFTRSIPFLKGCEANSEPDYDLVGRYYERQCTFPTESLNKALAPPSLIDFISCVLDPDPLLRLSAFSALRHPWIEGSDTMPPSGSGR